MALPTSLIEAWESEAREASRMTVMGEMPLRIAELQGRIAALIAYTREQDDARADLVIDFDAYREVYATEIFRLRGELENLACAARAALVKSRIVEES